MDELTQQNAALDEQAAACSISAAKPGNAKAACPYSAKCRHPQLPTGKYLSLNEAGMDFGMKIAGIDTVA